MSAVLDRLDRRDRLEALDTVPACAACDGGAEAASGGRPLASQVRLRVDGVSLDYRGERGIFRATHRVGFDVLPGERFVLLGASGCGKSSLLKAVGGFVAPAEGRILVDGVPVAGPGPDRIAVFQEFDQLPPWKTVLENVAFPLIASGTAPRKEALERARATGSRGWGWPTSRPPIRISCRAG